jgi:hypothetical protein
LSKDPVGAPARGVPPNTASKLYSRAFNIALVTDLVLVEAFFRAATGEGTLTVVPAWLRQGSHIAVLGAVWLFATIAFALLAAATARNVLVALTGKADAYIFLGAQLNDGFHAVLERQRPWVPTFVPRFISMAWSPSVTFHAAYKRMLLLEDAEGNLTPVQALRTWRMVSSVFLQGLALAAGWMPCIVVAGMFKRGFPDKLQVPDAWAALNLPGPVLPIAVAVWVLANGAAVLVIRSRMGGTSAVERALPLPACVTRADAILQGTVVATEPYSTTHGSANRATRHYQRYAVRFDGPDFPLPIFVHWQGRRIWDADMASAGARLRKELQRERDHNNAAFGWLDAALRNRTPVDFLITEELAIVPKLPDREPFDPDSDEDQAR